jgi:hypothetical protein
MLKIIYTIDPSEKVAEIEWLNELKVYPVSEETYNWDNGKIVIKIGAIVDSKTALLIKLRHKLQFQSNYTRER